MGHQGPNPQLQQRKHILLSLSQYQHLQVAHQSILSDTRNYIAYTKKKKKNYFRLMMHVYITR